MKEEIKYCVFDLETNGAPKLDKNGNSSFRGKNPNPYFSAITIGYLILGQDLLPISKGKDGMGVIMLNRGDIPADKWNKYCEHNVHGLSRELSMRKGIDAVEGLNKFREIMDSCTYRVAHNADFDDEALEATYLAIEKDRGLSMQRPKDKGRICTRDRARAIWPGKPANLKDTWARCYPNSGDFEKKFNHHEALSDCIACGHILHSMITTGRFQLMNIIPEKHAKSQQVNLFENRK